MKFKVTKDKLNSLLSQFDNNDHGFMEIELEPVYETCAEVTLHRTDMNRSYEIGYKDGYNHGHSDAENYRQDYIDRSLMYYPQRSYTAKRVCLHCGRDYLV